MEIQIISPTAHQCSTNINNSRKRCQPMQKTRRKNFVYVSITKYPLRGAWNIDYENNCAHLKVKGSFHSAM